MVDDASRKPLGASSPLAVPGTIAAGSGPPPVPRQYLTSEEFEAKYGADPDDVARVRAFAAAHGLEVRDVDLARRTVTLAGKAADVARAFSVGFARFAGQGAVYRGHVGQPSIPAD